MKSHSRLVGAVKTPPYKRDGRVVWVGVRRDKGGRRRGWPRASAMSDDERRWWAAAAVVATTSSKTATAAVVGNRRLQLAGCPPRPQSPEPAPPITRSRTRRIDVCARRRRTSRRTQRKRVRAHRSTPPPPPPPTHPTPPHHRLREPRGQLRRRRSRGPAVNSPIASIRFAVWWTQRSSSVAIIIRRRSSSYSRHGRLICYT